MEMFELETFKNKNFKNSDRSQSKMEMTEVRVTEYEGWSVDISLNSEKKKLKRAPGIWGTTKSVTFVPSDFQKENGKCTKVEKIFEIITAKNLPNLAKI